MISKVIWMELEAGRRVLLAWTPLQWLVPKDQFRDRVGNFFLRIKVKSFWGNNCCRWNKNLSAVLLFPAVQSGQIWRSGENLFFPTFEIQNLSLRSPKFLQCDNKTFKAHWEPLALWSEFIDLTWWYQLAIKYSFSRCEGLVPGQDTTLIWGEIFCTCLTEVPMTKTLKPYDHEIPSNSVSTIHVLLLQHTIQHGKHQPPS